MEFSWPQIGNLQVSKYLERSILNHKLAQAYIFNGIKDLGKNTLAMHLAKILFCQDQEIRPCEKCQSCRNFARNNQVEIKHSDLYLLKREKDKKNISIKKTRELINKLEVTSFQDGYKIGIIDEAELMSLEALNAILKTLEEPRDKVIIIMIANNIKALPETIVSRCQVLNFYPVSTDDIYHYLLKEKSLDSRSRALNIARLSLGRLALAKKFFDKEDLFKEYQENATIFLDFYQEDLNERWLKLEKILETKVSNQEHLNSLRNILDIWLGVLRDCLLASTNQFDLIQFKILEDRIKEVANKTNLKKIFDSINLVNKTKEYLNYNVNPKLAFENLIIEI